HRAQVQYDLPEGNARKAMEQYMDVMNRAKKEELAQLLGVDIYV
ncbi:chromosome partitioning protein ParA, partial [Vibrio sp. 2099]|nr:chromosome partitioning protein ParA [Vibrio sp. 2099]